MSGAAFIIFYIHVHTYMFEYICAEGIFSHPNMAFFLRKPAFFEVIAPFLDSFDEALLPPFLPPSPSLALPALLNGFHQLQASGVCRHQHQWYLGERRKGLVLEILHYFALKSN